MAYLKISLTILWQHLQKSKPGTFPGISKIVGTPEKSFACYPGCLL